MTVYYNKKNNLWDVVCFRTHDGKSSAASWGQLLIDVQSLWASWLEPLGLCPQRRVAGWFTSKSFHFTFTVKVFFKQIKFPEREE